jgi:hypothetical protein
VLDELTPKIDDVRASSFNVDNLKQHLTHFNIIKKKFPIETRAGRGRQQQ